MTPLLSREQAAALLRISVDSFARHVQAHLPSVRIGRQLMFDEKDLETWVESQKGGHGAAAGDDRAAVGA